MLFVMIESPTVINRSVPPDSFPTARVSANEQQAPVPPTLPMQSHITARFLHSHTRNKNRLQKPTVDLDVLFGFHDLQNAAPHQARGPRVIDAGLCKLRRPAVVLCMLHN